MTSKNLRTSAASAIAGIICAIFLLHKQENKTQFSGIPDKPGEAQSWYASRHAGREGGFIPTDHVLREIAKTRAGKYGRLGKSSSVNWVELGPDNIGGRTRALLIDPSSTSTLYVAAVGGGVWKSEDAGSSWNNTTNALGNIAFTCLAFAPGGNTANRTIYGGTGEGYYNVDAIRGAGLFRTTDSGASWVQLASAGAMSAYINKIAVDPSNANYIYIGTNNGLFRSTDGGGSFTSIGGFSGRVQDLALHPTAPDTLYITQNGSGVYKSSNVRAAAPGFTLIRSKTGQQRIEIALSDLKPSVLYAVFTNSSHEPANIERSGDGGVNWVAGTIPTNNDSYLSSYMNTQGWYDNMLGVNPANELTMYVGGVDTYKSTNGGSTWSKMTSWRTYTAPYVHADHHEITFESGSIFYLVNDGGVFRTTDGGTSWTDRNNNFSVTQFYYGGMSASGSVYIGGTQDNGTLSSTGSPSWNSIRGGDGGASLISHTNSAHFYASYVRGYFYRSTNSGSSWTNISPTNAGTTAYEFIAPAEMSQSNSSLLVTGGTTMYRSSNSGTSWTGIYTIPSSRRCTAIGLSLTADTIIIGTTSLGVYRTTNAGTAWASVAPPGMGGNATDAEVSLANPNIAHITAAGYGSGGHLFRTTNLGSATPTWTDISTSLPALPGMSVVTLRSNPNHIFYGTEAGVFESTDGGASWTAANAGLAGAASVEDLDTRYDGSLLASTHGRGIFLSAGVLPVELAAFSASRTSEGVLLRWRTVTESNNLGFDIERRDGTAWTRIGHVPGGGNVSTPRFYSFLDRAPYQSSGPYRLKQIDRDGTTAYSPERSASASPAEPVRIFPNPARSGETVAILASSPYPVELRVSIYDSRGRRVMERQGLVAVSGVMALSIPTAGLLPGVYIAVTDMPEKSVAHRFTVTR